MFVFMEKIIYYLTIVVLKKIGASLLTIFFLKH